MNFSIYARAKTVTKESVYEYYSVLEDFPEDYEKITRKKMLGKCVEIYKENPNIIFEIFSQEELELLSYKF